MPWCGRTSPPHASFAPAPAYARFIGYPAAELVGRRFDELLAPEDREREIAQAARLRDGTTVSVTSESRYVRKDGAIVWALRSVTAVREGGIPRYAFVILQDITERKKAREEVVYLASHDALTGLANRVVFQSELADAIAGRAADGLVSVMIIDIDGFKGMNDTLGHAAGDTILREVARRLRAAVSGDDVLARVGGDEFAILRRHAESPAEIAALAVSLIDRLKTPYPIGNAVVTGVSMGIALAPTDGLDADELTKKADIALSSAKQEVRGSYRFFQSEMEERLRDRHALKVDLAAALSNNELKVVYQPIVELRTGKVASFEALLRWRHPSRGTIQPTEFIPLAEETGLIVPIGEWVLGQACREAMSWPTHVGVSVNVSSAQFRSPSLALRVADALARSGLKAGHLEIEITETLLLGGSESNLRMLNDLRRLGVKIALDDFGTGYSSLGYLQQFPFDKIKIDRSFVNDVTEREEARAVIRALIGLGHSLNMRITAEGVETEAQLERITAKGCDEGQGFIFSPPVAASEVLPLIARIEGAPLPVDVLGARRRITRRSA